MTLVWWHIRVLEKREKEKTKKHHEVIPRMVLSDLCIHWKPVRPGIKNVSARCHRVLSSTKASPKAEPAPSRGKCRYGRLSYPAPELQSIFLLPGSADSQLAMRLRGLCWCLRMSSPAWNWVPSYTCEKRISFFPTIQDLLLQAIKTRLWQPQHDSGFLPVSLARPGTRQEGTFLPLTKPCWE